MPEVVLWRWRRLETGCGHIMKYSECFGLYPEGMGGEIQKVLERSAYRMEKEWEEEWGSGGGGVGVGWAEMGQEAHYACFSH